MQLIKLAAAAGFGVIFLTACVTQHPSRYAWGDYDGSLYTYYKNPAKSTAYMEALSKVVTEAGASKKTIAPGLYAEYGYMLLQQKKTDEAIVYFNKEKQTWPESGYFMDGMIKNARIVGSQKEAAAALVVPAASTAPADSASPTLIKSALATTKE
jgi:hypothetical protein